MPYLGYTGPYDNPILCPFCPIRHFQPCLFVLSILLGNIEILRKSVLKTGIEIPYSISLP